jgi:MFS family permease
MSLTRSTRRRSVLSSAERSSLFAAVGHRLSRHLSMNWIVAIGNLLVGLGAALMAMSARSDVDYWTQLFPGWLIIGAGVGFALPNLLASATDGLPPTQVSTGSAIVNTSRQFGYVFGVTLLVAILGTLSAATPADATNSFRWSWWMIAAVSLLAVL